MTGHILYWKWKRSHERRFFTLEITSAKHTHRSEFVTVEGRDRGKNASVVRPTNRGGVATASMAAEGVCSFGFKLRKRKKRENKTGARAAASEGRGERAAERVKGEQNDRRN